MSILGSIKPSKKEIMKAICERVVQSAHDRGRENAAVLKKLDEHRKALAEQAATDLKNAILLHDKNRATVKAINTFFEKTALSNTPGDVAKEISVNNDPMLTAGTLAGVQITITIRLSGPAPDRSELQAQIAEIDQQLKVIEQQGRNLRYHMREDEIMEFIINADEETRQAVEIVKCMENTRRWP